MREIEFKARRGGKRATMRALMLSYMERMRPGERLLIAKPGDNVIIERNVDQIEARQGSRRSN